MGVCHSPVFRFVNRVGSVAVAAAAVIRAIVTNSSRNISTYSIGMEWFLHGGGLSNEEMGYK